MTVRELITELSEYGSNEEVFVATDEEGNSFHAVESLAICEADEFPGSGPIVIWPGGAPLDF